MKKSLFLSALCFFLAVTAIMSFTGCSADIQPSPGPVMVEVYDDGLYTVDAGRVYTVTEDDGSLTHIVHLHIANRTKEPLVISTLLGAYVECGEERLGCVSLHSHPSSGTDYLDGIDGLIEPGYYTDGWVAFTAGENERGAYVMNLAVDYGADKWITFELPYEDGGSTYQ